MLDEHLKNMLEEKGLHSMSDALFGDQQKQLKSAR